jgi:hypothetical protein
MDNSKKFPDGNSDVNILNISYIIYVIKVCDYIPVYWQTYE